MTSGGYAPASAGRRHPTPGTVRRSMTAVRSTYTGRMPFPPPGGPGPRHEALLAGGRPARTLSLETCSLVAFVSKLLLQGFAEMSPGGGRVIQSDLRERPVWLTTSDAVQPGMP
ncbi:hypothetical protein A176_004073 [Myxococcus hansupus]|uniref:Uncharacterized protein n=1 Tax=Pseudomyxococcus hansupus TaxID=1297742 RepID=A0A0H4WUQ8_9BACT|nr:hypothetical protein A176_004073 [Myxococcus hansupus]